jgi:branched-chain amino acid transport system permease protein
MQALRDFRSDLAARVPPWGGKAFAAALLVFAVLLPFALQSGGTLMFNCTVSVAYIVMGLGLNTVVGFAGLLDLGYVAFFAIGAYTTGWLSSGFYANANIHFGVSKFLNSLPGIHLNWLIVVLAAAFLCAIAGIVIGLPTLRLRGDYIAIVTLAFGEIVRVFATNGDEIHPFGAAWPLTAGRQGITPIDQLDLPFLQPFNQLNLRPWYWTGFVLMVIVLFITIRVRDSRLGRAWIAIREDEVAAASMGVPLVKTKLQAYATGAAFGGMSGAFLGAFLNTVNADQFQFGFSILILAMIILGGLGSVWGVVAGAISLTFIQYYFIPNVFNSLPSKLGLSFNLVDVEYAIYGFLLVLMMVLRPEGLLPERRHKLEMTTEGVATDESVYEVRL